MDGIPVKGRGTPVLTGGRVLTPPTSRFGNAAQPEDVENQYSAKTLLTVDLSLGAAVENVERQVAGTFLWYGSALDSSNVVLFDRPIAIRLNRSTADLVTLLPGMAISGVPFDKIYITIPSGYASTDVGQLIVSTDGPLDRIRFE